jgi:hypothetical protein
MRKTFMILLLLGVVAFLGQGSAIAATWTSISNADIVDEDMNLGNDYTRTWKEMGYNSGVGPDKSLMNPCPQWTTPGYGGDDCAALAFTTYEPFFNPVTGYGDPMDSSDPLNLGQDGTILDDLFSNVTDSWTHDAGLLGTYSGTLDQDLDILFAMKAGGVFEQTGDEGAHNANYVIDQSLDQQLAYWEGTGVLNPATDNGITQRLVLDFAKINTDLDLTPTTAPDGETVYNVAESPTETAVIDQWVVQWLRDIEPMGGGQTGIDQYYSQWFVMDGAPDTSCSGIEGATGISCNHTYFLGHEGINKEVSSDFNHDHTP